MKAKMKKFQWEACNMEFLWFLVGLLLGGCVSFVIICCLQINRINDYEEELRNLRFQLNLK